MINLTAIVVRTSAQSSSNRAGLVVQYSDGQVVTRCVTFTEPEITGYDLLKRSGLPLVVDIQSGGTLCKIGNSGCNFPAQQCFCDCQVLNQSCVYWIYYFQANGAWKYSSLGMSSQKVTNGAVNGWIYGAGNASSSSTQPPLITLDQICGATSQALPVATSVSTQASQSATATKSAPVTTTAIPTSTTAPQATSVTAAATLEPTATVTPTALSAAGESTVTLTPTSAASSTATTTSLPNVTATPTSEPEATATLTPTVAVSGQPGGDEPGASEIAGYALFGAIAGGLAVLLLVTRRNAGNRKS
ncbi:MAG: hypothetical protein M1434_10005 [Chloroflexi bacterium]|nr:hypothetical protein [Chloroflexota bacterium]